MAKTYPRQVLEISTKPTKTGAAMLLKTVDDKGRPHEELVFKAELKAIFTKPGLYEMAHTKNGTFYDISEARFLRPLENGAQPAAAGKAEPAKTDGAKQEQVVYKQTLDRNTEFQNKSIISQVSIKAAADVIVALIANGKLPAPIEGTTDEGLSETSLYAQELAGLFMDAAKNFVYGKKEDPKPDQKDAEGA